MSEHRPTARIEIDVFSGVMPYEVAEEAWEQVRRMVNNLSRPVVVVTMPDDSEHSVDLSKPPHPAAPPLSEVATWGRQVADDTTLQRHPGCCQICADPENHGGDYCPTGITRQMAEWVRVRRENKIGPRYEAS